MSTQAKFFSLLAVVALVVGAYFLGSSQKNDTAVDNQATTSSNTESSSAEAPAATSSMPANHPKIDQPQTLSQSIQSNAEQASSKFTHFRVGNRNVKSIFAEKDKVWVGTSGGVIRYVPELDDYRLFDVKNGLLANGIFHVSRWTDTKMLVGTYGGGLAIYDEI
ncbi:MAG: regulator, partial [Gammaproteobacteria bacterium]|nr:regulator [Gammaproteobacteria bacterium]